MEQQNMVQDPGMSRRHLHMTATFTKDFVSTQSSGQMATWHLHVADAVVAEEGIDGSLHAP
jgi:hypothetical protein